MSKKLSKVYGDPYGLSTPEWRVLAHVVHCEKMSVREIHDSVSLDKPSVSRAVSKLEKASLLAKSTSDRDHRLVEIEVTDKGLEVFQQIVPEALAFETVVLKTFNAEDRQQLDDLLTRLQGVLDEQTGEV
ncbi:MAG: MarR family winged helix-turn-helix transcriptional regulator [Sulfitobacter sp.]|uniref:MarR family winged helix-turn-helix transcriptional regulator n=1 Tax=Alphaproteobacteria TaxID=28211 RepID=UPI00294258C6|nr:MarR family winged helix-turn-helix transcriptional regulator [Sulfitobacter sp. LC.270.F.C4]WOI15280.1 MarR family winged helix-turn-helix transcriptional regulator [Sulfitobacter sp. LC.270.F.C4]